MSNGEEVCACVDTDTGKPLPVVSTSNHRNISCDLPNVTASIDIQNGMFTQMPLLVACMLLSRLTKYV